MDKNRTRGRSATLRVKFNNSNAAAGSAAPSARATRAVSRGRANYIMNAKLAKAMAAAAGAAATVTGPAAATRSRTARAASRGRIARVEAMRAVAAERAAKAAAAAAPGAGAPAPAPAAVATAVAAAAELYVYFTVPNKSGRFEAIAVCSMSDCKVAKITDFGREEMEKLIIDSNGHCGTNVSATFLEEQLPKNPMLFVLSNTLITERGRKDSSVPVCIGFILARETDDKRGIYLDIICTAPRMGTPFISFFHNHVFGHPKRYDYIQLSSLANVLTYYPRLGYEFRHSCEGAPLAELSDALKKRDFKARPAPEDTYKAYEDKEYMDFMYDTLYKRADLGVYEDNECKNQRRPLNRMKYADNDCARDGFTMTLCRKPAGKAGGHRTRKNRR